MSITFDGVTKIATLSLGTVSLSVLDIWSRWNDWLAISDNSKYLPMFTTVGGDVIDASSGTSVPTYAFLQNGWRIKPQESNHTLNVTNGILLVNGGGDPFVNTTGNFIVRINYSQPVQAITVSTGGGSGGATAADIWAYGDKQLTTVPPTAPAIANAVWSHIVETLSAEEIMRVTLAVLAGKRTGLGTATENYMAVDGVTPRISLTPTDAAGNGTPIVNAV